MLYTWRDALYDRSQLSAPIGKPTGFKHKFTLGLIPITDNSWACPSMAVNPTSSKAENPAVVPATPDKLRCRQSKRSPDTSEDTVSKSVQSTISGSNCVVWLDLSSLLVWAVRSIALCCYLFPCS